MSDAVKPERVHYREYTYGLSGRRVTCHECHETWPCRRARLQSTTPPWWYISPQQPKVKHDPEG